MRWIYISPHLDDAVLSAGGLIYEQTRAGIPVEIWTVICGIPGHRRLSDFARVLHFAWGTGTPRQTVLLRRREDRAAAAIVGARVRHFDVPDCIYRLGPDGEFLYQGIFVPPHPAEADLPARIAADLAAHLRPDDVLAVPLSIGGHVDHVTVTAAARLLGRPLLRFADIPYLFGHPDSLPPAVAGMRETIHPVSQAGLEAWQTAIAAYASQISSVFTDLDDMRAKIHAYWQPVGGLRLWTAPDAGAPV